MGAPRPILDFELYKYTATVCVSKYPGYSEAYGEVPPGYKTRTAYKRGEITDIIKVRQNDKYVSALTHPRGVWINIWCSHNKEGEERAVNFCNLVATRIT